MHINNFAFLFRLSNEMVCSEYVIFLWYTIAAALYTLHISFLCCLYFVCYFCFIASSVAYVIASVNIIPFNNTTYSVMTFFISFCLFVECHRTYIVMPIFFHRILSSCVSSICFIRRLCNNKVQDFILIYFRSLTLVIRTRHSINHHHNIASLFC